MMRTMRPASLARLLSCGLCCGLTFSCADATPSHGSAEPSAPAAATGSPAGSAAASSSASAAPTTSASAKPLAAPERKTLLKHLTAGRLLANDKKYAEAVAELDRALAVDPLDATVLAEVGWAAFLNKDYKRALEATTLALKNTNDPKLRAQALYSRGRAHEAQEDKGRAREDYAESLRLRDNDTVKKRLVDVGGTPAASAGFAVCDAGFATPEALCSCLVGKASELLGAADNGADCEVVPHKELGEPRFSLLRLTAKALMTEATVYLVSKDDGRLRPVAELGRDYEPGAFGVHSSVEITKGQLVVPGKLVMIEHAQIHDDTNMAGLELCQDHVHSETLCVLGSGASPTTCPVSVPVLIKSGCGAGFEPTDLDDETKQLMETLKKGWSMTTTKTSWSVDNTGKLLVKFESGDKTRLTDALFEPRVLFSP